MKRVKKRITACTAVVLSAAMVMGSLALPMKAEARVTGDNIVINELPGTVSVEKSYDNSFLSVAGYVEEGVSDRTCYYEEYLAYNELLKEQFIADGGKAEDYVMQNTDNYYVANNEKEFCVALRAYPKVIEVTADLNLGYKYLESQGISTTRVEAASDYKRGNTPLTSPDLMEDGVSKITFDDVHGMTIYSQNGSSIRHAEFQFSNSSDIVVRNLNFQCMNEWDDYPVGERFSGTKPGNRKRYDWDLITIYNSKDVWIDHCTFGLAYDGTIDITDNSTASITWCEIGLLDEYGVEELWNSINYMEESYQAGKGFQGYNTMRNAGATPEQIYRFAKLSDKVHAFSANDLNYDVNIYDKVTMAYNYYEDTAQRVPQIWSGNVHMYNCWMDCMEYLTICNEIDDARWAMEAAGISRLGLCRANSARCGGTIGTDTCIFEGVTDPIIGNEIQPDGTQKGAVNHNLIVNSSVQKHGSNEVYIGSSWDNNGDNEFTPDGYWSEEKPAYGDFKWALWKDLTKNPAEASDTVTYVSETEATAMAFGEFYEKFYIGQDNLEYEYQVVPLEELKETLTSYAGCGKVDLQEEWLKTNYSVSEETCTVTFQFDEYMQAAHSNTEVAVGSTITEFPTVEPKTGYVANGWYTKEYVIDEDGYSSYNKVAFTEDTVVTKDTTVFVNWEPIKIAITLETNGGITSEDTLLYYDYGSYIRQAEVVLSDLTKPGYEFAGWYRDEELTFKLGTAAVLKPITLYAKWKEVVETPTPTATPVPTATPLPTETPAPEVLYGDVNLDGNVTAEDALETLKAVVKLTTLDEAQTKAAEVTGDGEVTAEDALEILKKVVKLIEKFPVEEANEVV